jgi:membrane-bound serine protease (ClpP class)
VRYIIKAHRKSPTTGQEGLIGEEGTAMTEVNENGGQVFVHGEYWNALSDTPIAKDTKVTVESVIGLKIKVASKIKGG